MSISYRQLIKWRKEALHQNVLISKDEDLGYDPKEKILLNNKILSLTQELIDQYLIRRKS